MILINEIKRAYLKMWEITPRAQFLKYGLNIARHRLSYVLLGVALYYPHWWSVFMCLPVLLALWEDVQWCRVFPKMTVGRK